MPRFVLVASLPWATLLITTLCASAGELPIAKRLPPEVAYRDPTYLPPPPPPPVLVPASAPRSLSLPLYNEPPHRF